MSDCVREKKSASPCVRTRRVKKLPSDRHLVARAANLNNSSEYIIKKSYVTF